MLNRKKTYLKAHVRFCYSYIRTVIAQANKYENNENI